MKNTFKKSFAILMVICMVMGIMPFGVFAATTNVATQAELQNAVANAASGDVINVTADIQLTSAISVGGNVTITSSTGKTILRAASYKSYMFVVANGGTLTLEDITVNGNKTSHLTADLATELIVVQAGGTLNFNDGAILTTNRFNATVGGGGITVVGTLNMNGGTIANIHGHNSSSATTQYGAAINVMGGTVNMYGGLIGAENIGTANQNDGRNGAVGVITGTFNMYGGAISGNVANEQGGGAGGVYIANGGTFNLDGGSVSNNNSRRNGGGFYNDGTLNIKSGIVSGNTATYTDYKEAPTIFFGGGILNNGVLNISGGEISGNAAESCGGGIYNYGTMTITGGTIANNVSQTYSAGGIFVDGTGTLAMSGGAITGNSAAQYGGAIAVTSTASNALVITAGEFANNTCGSNQCGADIFITTANTSNVAKTYSKDCVAYTLYLDNIGSRYSASNAVAAPSNVLTANNGYVYVAGGEAHNFGAWTQTKAPTCTTAGSDQRICSDCKKVETRTVAALGHSYNAGVVTKAPTCTTTGTKLFTCTVCSATKTETLAALGHTKSNLVRVEPTCTEAGYESYTCKVCGEAITTTLAATGHSGKTVRTEPTCTLPGSVVTTCTKCSYVISSSIIPATGHTEGEWVVTRPATKEETGLKVLYCAVCDAELRSEVIPVIPDATITVTTVETTTDAWYVKVPVTIIGNEGLYAAGFYVAYPEDLTLTGVVAGDTFTTVVASPYNVNPATDARAAEAFAAAGVDTTGKLCYRYYAENIVIENITNDGVVCTLVFDAPSTWVYEYPITLVPIDGMFINVDAEEVEMVLVDGSIIVPELNTCTHDAGERTVTKEATCTAAGAAEVRCTLCGYLLRTEVIAATGHAYSGYVETLAPTCTTVGQKTATCSNCGATQYESIDALGHSYSDYVETLAPTCTTAGRKTATCGTCGITATLPIAALGHTPGEWTVEVQPGAGKPGLRTRRCTVCSELIEEEELPPTDLPKFTVSSVEAEAGSTATVTITMENNPGITATTLYLYYDEALTASAVSFDGVFAASEVEYKLNLVPANSAGARDAFEYAGVSTDGKLASRILWANSENGDLADSGVIATFTIEIPADATGTYDLGIACYTPDDLLNWDLESVDFSFISGGITIVENLCDHNWGAWTTTKPATCTDSGIETRTCSLCGDVETNVLAATGHDYGEAVVTEATCTEAGSSVTTCANCGDVQTEVLEALGHDPQNPVTVEATCTEAGSITATCTRCGVNFVETIPAKGHSYSDAVITTPPTCTEAGETTATCSACGETVTGTVPATGHTAGDWVIEGTEMKKYCTVCGALLETQAVPSEPTITVSATDVVVGETVTVTLTMTGNPGITATTLYLYYDEVLTASAASFDGVFAANEVEYKLNLVPANSVGARDAFEYTGVSTDGKLASRILWANSENGDLTDNGVIATFTFTVPEGVTGDFEIGIACYTPDDLLNWDLESVPFEFVSDTFTVSEAPACNHIAGEPVVVDATCTEAGSTTTSCILCGATISTEVIPALGHAVGAWEVTTPATETADGEMTLSCSRCELIVNTAVIPATGDPSIVMSNEVVKVGENATLTITMNNNPGIFGGVWLVAWNDSIEYVGLTYQGEFAELEQDYIKNVSVADNKEFSRIFNELGLSTEGMMGLGMYIEIEGFEENFTGNGLMATLEFTGLDEVGTQDIIFAYVPGDVCNVDLEDVDFRFINGSIEVVEEIEEVCKHEFSDEWTIDEVPTEDSEGSKSRHCIHCGEKTDVTVLDKALIGDVDGNGRVNIMDLRLLTAYMSGTNTKEIVEWNADARADGKITIMDIRVIKSIVAG